jgi:Raf kinase inhibitor-like YbhB/YbcL family protein
MANGGSLSPNAGRGGAPLGGTSSAGSAGTASGGKAGAGAGGFAGAAAGTSSGGEAGASAGAAGSAAAGVSGMAGSAGRGGAAGAGGAPSGGGGAGGAGGAAAGSAGKGGGGSGGASGFTLTNPDFVNKAGCGKDMASACAVFPRDLASFMSGPNISPELAWSGTPAGTQSFALLLQDLTNTFAHWALWNIPATLTMVPENIDKSTNMPAMPAGSRQTNASFAAGDGYFGPGSECNVYEFVLYALSVPTFTPTQPNADAGAVRTQLDALGAQILGKASLRGRQNHNMTCP